MAGVFHTTRVISTVSPPNIFGHYFIDGDGHKKAQARKTLADKTKDGRISNIDYSVYKRFRKIIKGHANALFPKLFDKEQKYCIKGKVEIKIEDGKVVFSRKKAEESDNILNSLALKYQGR